MKKLLYLGFTALMMLFAVPNVVRAQGDGDTQMPTAILMPGLGGQGPIMTSTAEVGRYAFLSVALTNGGTLDSIYYSFDGTEPTAVGENVKKSLPNEDLNEAIVIYTDVEGASATLKVKGFYTPGTDVDETAEGDEEATVTTETFTQTWTLTFKAVTKPTFTPEAGDILEGGKVTIAAAETDVIYYSTDGTLPTIIAADLDQNPSVKKYTAEGITVDADMTIKAIAYKGESAAGFGKPLEGGSELATAAYVIATTATPTFKVGEAAATSYKLAADEDAKVTVTIVAADGATVYYTTDGTNPTTELTAATSREVEISSACTLKVIARETGKKVSAVASFEITKAVAVPADAEDAPAITFTPANTDSVDNNTEILISVPNMDKYQVDYGVFSSVEDALEAGMRGFEPYGGMMGGYPTVTEESPILVVQLFDGEKTIKYYRAYKVRAASEVAMPGIYVPESETYNMFQICSKGDQVQFMAEEVDAIYYTTDGSKPTVDNGTKLEKDEDGVAGGYYTLESSVIIKAIAVKDGKASDVAVARYNLVEDLSGTLSLSTDSLVSKGVPVGFSMTLEELGEAGANIPYMRPLTVYYTLDGETEPTQEAYEEWQEKDAAHNPIKKVSAEVDEDGYPVMDDKGNTVSMTLTEAGQVSFKGKGYLLLGDTKGLITTATVSKTLQVLSAEAPEFSLVSGTEVNVGDSLVIKTIYPDTVESTMYFSFDGTTPSSSAYFSDENDPYSVFAARDGVEIKMFFGKDERGEFAYVPTIRELFGYPTEYDTVRFEDVLSIEVVQTVSLPTGKTNMMGRPETIEVTSDVVKGTYMIMKDFPKPVIIPDGGIVVKGEEVEISAGEGLEIYYTVDGSKPEKGATATKKYEAPVVVNEALTIKAIAFKAGENGARDSVSNVAEAVFTLVPEMAVKAVGNTVKNDSIIFADGNVAFDMFIKDFTEADSVFRLHVTVWNTANEDDFPLADVFEAKDSVRFVNNYYNGKYEATFALMQPDRRGGYSAAQDTTITFYVTENEEIIEEYELTVNPVDATKEGENVVFTAEDVAFDVLVKGLAENNDLSLKAFFYTKVEYDSMKQVEPKTVNAADSVRFSTKLADGEYMAVFQLTREIRGSESVVEEAEFAFNVKKKTSGGDTTAVEVKELAGVKVYPNPSEGEFNVVAPANAQVEIFTAAGVLVKRMVVAEGMAQVRLNNSGIYFVRVSANKQVAIRKVVIR